MRTFFFADRTLVLCTPDELSMLSLPADAAVLYNGSNEDIASAVGNFDATAALRHLYIVGEDIGTMYNTVCGLFTEVDAAGGVVENDRKEVLMIYRNGLWDLPKGHREPGEEIEVTAAREVEEECGIKVDELGALICITDHTYHRDGKFVLKHTYWYRMKVHGNVQTVPQTEEGISEIRWVSKTDLTGYMGNTYPSIRTVLDKYSERL